MLEKHPGRPQAVRTAYYVMPLGKLFSTYNFSGSNFEKITPDSQDDVMAQLRKGYTERRREINEGKIETADNLPILDIEYMQAEGVYPLEQKGKKVLDETTGKNKNIKIKTENKYSDYKCFTI